MAVVVGKEKPTSGLEDNLRFWRQKKLAKEVLSHHKKVKALDTEAFQEVEWSALMLMEVSRMFHIWACKQVCCMAGTNEMHAW